MIVRTGAILGALALLAITYRMAMSASVEEANIRVGTIDAVLSMLAGANQTPVALLIAGSGRTDRDGNRPGAKPAALKKLSEQLVARMVEPRWLIAQPECATDAQVFIDLVQLLHYAQVIEAAYGEHRCSPNQLQDLHLSRRSQSTALSPKGT